MVMPQGAITRGTTNTNRLRRSDRWLATWPGLRRVASAHAVDLGYGASSATTRELAARVKEKRPYTGPERLNLGGANEWLVTGSPGRLVARYNALVDAYNALPVER